MNISFKKITRGDFNVNIMLDSSKCDFLENDETLSLKGKMTKLDNNFVKFQGKLNVKLNLVCCKSGEDFTMQKEQDLVLFFSDGMCEKQSQIDSLDIIEFMDGLIDFDFILNSEIESIRLDYNVKDETWQFQKDE